MSKSMKKLLGILLVLILMGSLLTACTGKDKPTEPATTVEPTETPAATEEPTTEPTKEVDETEEEPTKAAESSADDSAKLAIDAVDGNQYNTMENPVPFGQWVSFTEKNYYSEEYVPFYMRITKVSRDPAEVEAALASYDGYTDLTLSEDQARDMEFALVEYEYYYPPDYQADEYGINPHTISFSADPKYTTGFETEGGMSYIGVGTKYSVDPYSSENPKPGDTVPRKDVFTVLKNYDETEYVFQLTWYDGEIDSANARELYFAATS